MGLVQKTNSTEILLCEKCKGEGTVSCSELADYHKGEYHYWNEVCTKCKGTGRLMKTVTTQTETVPYDNPEVTMLLLKDTDDK